MTIDNTFTVKQLKNLETLYVVFSQITRIPYIECDEETFDDLVYIFSSEDAGRGFVDAAKAANIPVLLGKIDNKRSAGFYTQLYSVNVNAVKFHDGVSSSIIQLEEVAPAPDFEKMKTEKLPVMNPALALPTIYFLEELRRPNQKADDAARMQKVRELEEEMVMNLSRSKFLVIFEMDEQTDENGKKQLRAKIPFIRSKNGNTYQPVFSCLPEMQRFVGQVKDRKVNVRVATFQELPKLLAPETNGYVMDPNSLNLILSKDHVTRLAQRFGGTKEGAQNAEVKPQAKMESVSSAAIQSALAQLSAQKNDDGKPQLDMNSASAAIRLAQSMASSLKEPKNIDEKK